MPLTGGPADKAGNRYEARWTVACMARVMRGEYESVRLEPPGPEGEGIEFWLKRGEVREYHQVKRQGSRQGHWTLHNLDDRILPTFQSHLAADEHAKCVFVSSQDAFELRELAERAKSAKELSEFEREFVEGEWGRRFASLQQIWSVCSPADAFAFLRRIQVRTIDEETLRRHAELELAPLADCDPATAADVLFSYALEAIHQELDAALITERLRCRSIKRPVWSQPTSLFEVIQNANERYINRLRTELIRGELLHRDECATVISMLQENSVERGVIITGAAGAGKSTVQLQVIEKLQQQGTPILAFRIDLLEPTQQPDEAGRQIDLPASPVKTLAALAKGRPCVLIMDQLDAVSMVSGRNPSFFDCFDEMVRQALAVSSIRLVVACRSFDFENDYRLRRLGGRDGLFKNVEVGPLSDEAVRSTVQILGIDAKRLTEKQMQLLRVPAHLRLLSEITHDGMTNLAFQSTNELYGLYWNRKEHVLRARFGSSLSWVPVIDRLCVQMSTNQTLSVPMTVLDDFGSARDALLSEHVLVHDGSRVTFFHEGFFDYAFARRFAAKGEDLMKLLQTGEQHLFRRAQVRQILFQQREMDQLRYLDNLKVLLTSPTVRFHIKQIVFVLLKQFADPFELEWRVLESLLKDTEFPYSNELWFVTRTLPWFRLLDSLGIVKTLLESDEPKTIDATVRLLNGVRREAADRVAELVEPYVGTSNEWRDRHRYLVQLADLSAGQRFFNYFLRLLDNGDLEGMGRFHENDFLGMLYELPKRHADWACEAVGHYLLRELETSLSKGHSNPFRSERGMRSSQLADQILVDCAQRSPGPFVKHVLPFVLRVIELNPAREEEKLWFDEIWCLRHRDEGLSLSDHVLHALDGAIRSLAREKSDQFDAIAANLRRSNYETVQFLLIRGYAANGEKFADEGIGYLCEFPRRLRCGYFDAGYSHHVSCELIEAATPFCAAAHLEMLESILLEYYTDFEKTSEGRRWRGETQFKLLLAIDLKRRSPRLQSRIGEWQRKFNKDAPSEPHRSGVCGVGSPIPASAAEKMTDEQWVSAIEHYATDRVHEWRDGKPRGGAHQLSQTLEAQARKEPIRFARLVLRLPDGVNPAYCECVLRGLDAGTVEIEAIFDACRRCHRLPGRPTGSAFCDIIRKLPELAWPDDLLQALAWYATEDPNPDSELWRTAVSSSGQCYYGGDIYTAGINSVRGAAAGAIRALLLADDRRLDSLLPVLGRMVNDPSVAVRSCVATALMPVLNQDRELAVALFIELCATEDVLLKTHYVEQFVQYAAQTHLDPLRPIIERMLISDDPDVAQAGARQACLSYLDAPEAAELSERCLKGAEPLRAGAAQVFAANLSEARFRSICEAPLNRLFDDPAEKVRACASKCFDQLRADVLGELAELIESFQKSSAFATNFQHLIRALETTTARLPDVTIAACERFLEITGTAVGDMRTRAAGDAYRLSDLIIRAYHQAFNPSVSAHCLDVIDRLLCLGAHGMENSLSEFER